MIANTNDHAPPTASQLGVGMRLSLHPHCDDFAAVILNTLDSVSHAGLNEGLVVETDDVSTYFGADGAHAEQRLAALASSLISEASRESGQAHIVAHILLSRGCPGEVTCDLTTSRLAQPAPVELERTGIWAAAHWSLYPLSDSAAADGREDGYMAHIEQAISAAVNRGVAVRGHHYATKLTGDLADVVTTVMDAWARVGSVVSHVVSHATVAVHSPSHTQNMGEADG